MEVSQLLAKIRQDTGRRAHRVRRQGFIPAVVYGHGVESKNLQVPGNDFLKVYRSVGESSLIDLRVEGEAPVKVLIQEVQIDPVRDDIRHIDFRQVRMDEKLEAEIMLKFVGESSAVKGLGGILVKNLSAFSVRCLPGALVHEIEVPLDSLAKFGDRITVANVRVPEGIEILEDPRTVVALVEEPRSEEELAALESSMEADVSRVEVTTAKKEEGAGEEGAAVGAEAKKEAKEKKE